MTLIEVLIAMAIGMMVIGGAMASCLFLGRSGASVANYSTIATNTSQALEVVAQDVRMASAVVWNGPTSITLTVENSYPTSGGKITYAFDTDATSPTFQCFYTKLGDAAASTTKDVLVGNVSTLTFSRFNRLGAVPTTDSEIRRLGVSMTVQKSAPTLVPATGEVVSANFLLRNN